MLSEQHLQSHAFLAALFCRSSQSISRKEVVVISGVGKIILPVDDQERAKEFWTTRIGFEVTTDAPYEDGRWLEVTPPDRSVGLVLSRRSADEPRPEVSEMLPHSPVFFTCEDIQQTYSELSGRGVKF